MKAFRIVLNIVLVVLLVGGAVAGVRWMGKIAQRPPQAQPERIVPRLLAPPVQPVQNYQVQLVGTGSARPLAGIDLVMEVSGKVVERAANLRSGRDLAEGELIVRLDDFDYQQDLAAAKRSIDLLEKQIEEIEADRAEKLKSRDIELSRLELAQEQLAKTRRLRERNAATDNDVDLAQDAVLARQAALQQISAQLSLLKLAKERLQEQIRGVQVQKSRAQRNIERATLLAPYNARVARCQLDVGDWVAKGQVVGEIYATGIMEVPVSVPAADLRWLDPGCLDACRIAAGGTTTQPAPGVDVALPEDPSRRITAQVRWTQGPEGISATWPGCVGRVEAGLDERTRTATVVVYVVNEAGSGQPLLDRNWFCEVTIDGKVLPEAFVLPRKAILPDESVYYVDAENRLRRKRIQIARYGRDTAVILPDGGLSAGDRVILQHVAKPVIGMTVTPLDELPTSTGPVTTGPASAGPDATAPTMQEARP